MGNRTSTGIWFQKIVNGTTDAVKMQQVREYATKIPEVVEIWSEDVDFLTNPQKYADDIKKKNIRRIVIAGNEPGMVKTFFTKAMQLACCNPKEVILAGFREHGAFTSSDTEKAQAILLCAIRGIPFELASLPDELPVHPDTLVIGGGIAGIQASLEIANGKQKVYLVEKTGTIGGHMAMFDKTFPTLDCAACILTPKMVEIGQHPFIELMTYCEVQDVKGEPGNYTVKVLKKARRVNVKTCIGCGTCAEKCPVKTPSEFDAGTTLRKAIYIPFPQAVPNKYMVDAEHCRWVQEQKCGVCVKACPVPDCINLDEKDEVLEIQVGNIIVATGFKPFDAPKAAQFGYGVFPNVLTSLEFERLINAAGPTGGNIVFRSQDKKGNRIFEKESGEPKSVAIIHCVGSRDEHHNKYCSKVCCMYSLKLAHLVKEKLPKADVFEYYIDMRAFGKGYEEFYNRIEHEGINIIRGRTAKVEQIGEKLKLRTEDIENEGLIEQFVDMVILAVGLEPREDAKTLAAMLGVTTDFDGWFTEANYVGDPVNTNTGGVSIAGVCQGPKDIPDTVAQASAASSRVLQSILNKKIRNSVKDVSLQSIENKVNELTV